MRLGQLQVFSKTSPAISLLRSPNAPYVVAFLFERFKEAGEIQIPLSELAAGLDRFIEDVRILADDQGILPDKPERYLTEWCADDKRWLRRVVVIGRDEPVCLLTPHSEAVLAFLDRSLDQEAGFIGTESRLKLIIQTLSELVMGASEDKKARLAQLRQQRTVLDEQIAHLESHEILPQKPAAKIKEDFSTALGLLKQLLGDFRGVEEKFRDITRQVQRRQTDRDESRGSVLAFALDEEDRLKQEDQGVSFHEFLRFIFQPAQQERLRVIIDELRKLRDLDDMREGMELVRRMVPNLLAEAEAVMRTTQRLSATLRHLLDQRTVRERQRVAEVLREVRSLAAQCSARPPVDEVSIWVDEAPTLYSGFSRIFWTPPTRLDAPQLAVHVVDRDKRQRIFADYAKLYGLNWKEMRSRVTAVVQRMGSARLSDLVGSYPLRVGVIEILGYLQIARDDHHIIQSEATEVIELSPAHPGQGKRLLEVPLVLFTKK